MMENTDGHLADESADPSEATPAAADTDSEVVAAESPGKSKGKGRRLEVSIGLRGVLIALAVLLGATALAALAANDMAAHRELTAIHQRQADQERAEQIGLEYATNAAEVDYKNLDAWKAKVVQGASPELTEKLGRAASQMTQLLAPLQWRSMAHPLAAKVRSENDGVYVVDCFVSVLTETIQSKDPLQSTATYVVTIDKTKNWAISDVGGLGAILGGN